MKPVYVAETMKQAIRDTRDGVNLFWGRSRLRERDEGGRRFLMNHGEELTNDDLNMDWFDFLMKHDHLWVGTPEFVVEKIEQYQSELNCDTFGLFHNITLLNFGQLMRSLYLFCKEVMPRLQGATVS